MLVVLVVCATSDALLAVVDASPVARRPRARPACRSGGARARPAARRLARARAARRAAGAAGGASRDRGTPARSRLSGRRRRTSGALGRSGGQIRRSSLLVGRGACHRPGRRSTPPSAPSRAPAGRSPAIAGVRSAVLRLGPGTSCPRRAGGRSSRRCPPPLLGRAVCLPSAASSAPTQRSRQALRFASLRESCRTRA